MKINIHNWDLDKRILATIAYFDEFKKGLTIEEIERLLLGQKVGLYALKRELFKLRKRIKASRGIYSLKSSKIDFKQIKTANALITKAEKWSWIFRYVPFVEMVAVCNYLPLGIADKDSDIDLFVVAKKKRIFLARIFLTVLTHLLGIRRHDGKIKSRFCLSFYASEDFMNLSDLLIENDIYFGYWLIALQPIYGSHKHWRHFFLDNERWINLYFDGPRFELNQVDSRKSIWKKFWENILNEHLGDFLETTLNKYFQKRNIRKTANLENASIIVNSRRLKFHNNDKRSYYRDRWMKKLKRLSIS